MNLLLLLLSVAVLSVIYLVGFFFTSVLLKVSEPHYFIGVNKPWISFRLRSTKFSIGTYFPLPGFAQLHTISNGEIKPMKYPWEFHGSSLSRRFIATLGGAISMLITSLLVTAGTLYFNENRIITKEEVNRLGIYPSPFAEELGFKRGDQVVAVNGKDYDDYADLLNVKVLLDEGSYYTILRDGQEMKIDLKGTPEQLMKDRQPFLLLLAPFEVQDVMPSSPAEVAGIRPGDRIIKADGHPIVKILDMHKIFDADEDGTILLEIERRVGGVSKQMDLVVMLNEEKRIGIIIHELINYTNIRMSMYESILAAPSKAFREMFVNLRLLVKITIGNTLPQQTLSGPVGIARTNGYYFWTILAVNAMVAAFWNILPLPKSAFWEMLALTYETFTGKAFSHARLTSISRIMTYVGIAFIIGWIIWISASDIFRQF